LNGLVTPTAVKSNSSASWSNGQASTSGIAQLVGLTIAGQSILTSNPNLSISLPGGISVIVNEQTSSLGGDVVGGNERIDEGQCSACYWTTHRHRHCLCQYYTGKSFTNGI
jgi:hypothetical protein